MSSAAIVIHPNEVLRQVCTPVTTIDDDLGHLVQRMRSIMSSANGIGLAAPQIGLSLRVALVGKFAMLNPRIVWASERQTVMEEGCLSIPGSRIRVLRPASVDVEYTDLTGATKIIRLNDRMAKCAQHEIDHLDGILIVDKMLQEAA